MGREYDFHREYAGCSVTVSVALGTVRELALLVDGHEAGHERVHGHRAQVRTLHTVLPCDPPQQVAVEVALPGPLQGDPVCCLAAVGQRLPMPQRRLAHRARPTEASWYR